ncbi:Mfa1 family fimbria major subunit [Alistipes sp. OttesenSCG-928-B03]|nr:Mfa1 family fimbria major subunit [Alistipes sp. OttesenSCG-928-B03]
MKKLSIFAALAAMTLFASCSKDNAGNGNGPEGDETKMGLTISFPKNTASRASTDNATADEMMVKDITLFLYGTGGEPAMGHLTEFDLTNDFNVSSTSTQNVYTLKHEKRVTTTTGLKSVYVGVNTKGSRFMGEGQVAGNLIDADANESLLNEFYTTSVAELIAEKDGLPGNTFRMFTKSVQKPTLVAETNPDWSKNNVVTVDVERQVAKMTADYAAGKTATTLTQWKRGGSDVYGTHTMKGYYLGQAGDKKMYRYPQYNLDGKQLTTTDVTGSGYVSQFKPLNTNGTALNATPSLTAGADKRTSFFGIENVSLNNVRKETTVAIFWTTFVPKKATVWDSVLGNATPGNPKAGWVEEDWTASKLDLTEKVGAANNTPVEEGSFWVIKHGDDYKFFYSRAESLEYANAFNLDGYANPPLAGGQIYQKGNSYFYAYLGEEPTYEFLRNQYYQLIVEGFNALGQPGTADPKDDPENPNPDPDPEPGEPDPEVPDPEEPTPGNEDETSLLLKVVVRQWDVKVLNSMILE